MKHIWSVLCRSSQIDIDTNNVSISNVFEQLIVNLDLKNLTGKIEGINIPVEYEMISFLVREGEKSKISADIILEIIDPTGKSLKTFTQKIEMPEQMRRLRTRFRIQGLGITASGVYKFVVKVKEENQIEYRVVSEVPLEVLISNPQNNPTKQ